MISQLLQKNLSLVMSSSMSNVISPILYAASSARSLAIRRNGVKIRLLVGNVAAKAMMAANAPRRHLAVLTARATITLHRSRAQFGFKKKKSNALRQRDVYRTVTPGDSWFLLLHPPRRPLHLTPLLSRLSPREYLLMPNAKRLRFGLENSHHFGKLQN